MALKDMVPKSWQGLLADELSAPYFSALETFLEEEWESQTIYPPEEDVFSALRYTPFGDVKVLLLGQDPYHGPGQAHGLSFSVLPGIKIPPSLRNMYKELATDIEGFKAPKHGTLTAWASQGMLMLNAVLTVRQKKPNSHKNKGWEKLTDAIIRQVSEEKDHVVFVLWGGYARKKKKLIDSRHTIIESAHPSPLSARNGFFGSQPFSQINEALEDHGQSPMDWTLPKEG